MEPRRESPVMTVDEVAIYLRIARSHAYEMVREGRIPSLRLGRKILISRSVVDRLLQVADAQSESSDEP